MLQRVIELLRPDVSTDAKLKGVSLLIGKTLEKYDSRLKTLEIKTLIPIERGEQGRPGRDGARGRDGVDGRDGLPGKDALPVKDGKDGKRGPKGADGVSVVDAEIAVDDHLVLKLSDGKIIDAGELPKADGTQSSSVHVSGNAYQITVSATAPSNPQVNDLWLDIS